MNLVVQFKQHNPLLFSPNAKYLLAVSGGVDSMVMLDVCLKNQLNIAIAHCNFLLRGEESMRDEKFVREAAQKYGIQIFVRTFETKKIAFELKLSTQETARNLRYAFFDELINEYQFNAVFTAHHQNDTVETIFINLLRGTGIKGLGGIKKQRDNIYRPLLFASRAEIEDYALENKIAYIEDSSNKKDDYLRNSIRHKVIPALENINENAVEQIAKSVNYIEQEVALHEWFMNHWAEEFCVESENGFKLDIPKLNAIPNAALLVKHLLKPDNVELNEINKLLQSNTGAVLETPTFAVLKNRDELVFRNKLIAIEISSHSIFENTTEIENLKIEIQLYDKYFAIEKNKQIAQLDFELLTFPLTLRKWKHGDTFQPFGMTGKKLVSDFLINHKVSMFDKEKVRVLESNGNIAWVVGMRIDSRFAVSTSTKKVMKITVMSS